MSGLFRALHRTKVFRNLTEQEFAWVLYDVGNSAFIMLACSLIPIWFKSLAIGTGPGKISSDQATAYYSIAISIVTVVVALIGPVCGVLADRKDKKKIFFTTPAGLGITGCVLNGVATSYDTAEDADYLIYNASIDSTVKTLDDLLAKDSMFADYKAVKEGNVWTTEKSMYQATDKIAQFTNDINLLVTGGDPDQMVFLRKLS